MIIRKIKLEELVRTYQVFALAFECAVDVSKPIEVIAEVASNSPKNRNDINSLERWAAFEDDDKTMMGFLIAGSYPIYFDENICKMSGIGAVSTLPEYRRRGVIRECFNYSLKYMYENDFLFSYLYPFSTKYYRQFGYELCCEKFKHTIYLCSIKPFDIEGNCYLVENGEKAINDIKAIHQDFIKGYNLTVVREDCDFSWVLKSSPSVDEKYTYVYKNKEGIPKGFFSFVKQPQGNAYNMSCSDFMFSDMEGFKGILNFAYSFSTYYEKIVFTLPSNIGIVSYLPETAFYPYKCEKLHCGMVRVINVEKVLQKAKYKGDGSVLLQVFDKQISMNSKTFQVTFSADKATEVSVSGKKPDISLDVTDFSRLIVGTIDSSDIKYLENVVINSNNENIAKMFYKKLNTVIDYF